MRTFITIFIGVVEHRYLSFILIDGGIDIGFASDDTSVIDEVSGREVVRTICYHIVARYELDGVVSGEHLFIDLDLYVRIEIF